METKNVNQTQPVNKQRAKPIEAKYNKETNKVILQVKTPDGKTELLELEFPDD